MQVDHIQVRLGEGMKLFLPWSMGGRDNQGQTYPAPAYVAWISTGGMARGPVFLGIDRWASRDYTRTE